jgi:2-hydroxychromene-2-carboxylate isomerase
MLAVLADPGRSVARLCSRASSAGRSSIGHGPASYAARIRLGGMPDALDAAFYFDLASPLAYLAAERVLQALGGGQARVNAEWQPVLARELPGEEPLEETRHRGTKEEIFRAEIERAARAQSLQPLKWPSPFPFDSGLAMRVATYAKSIGRTVPFVQAAFRQAFAGGHSLEDPDFVVIAAAACEMHPAAVLKGAELRSVREQLSTATALAAQAGVTAVPAVRIGANVFVGERAVEDAAAHVAKAAGPGQARRSDEIKAGAIPGTGREGQTR